MTATGPHEFYIATTEGGYQITFAMDASALGKGDEPKNWQTILTTGKVEGTPLRGKASPSFTLSKLKAYAEAFKARGVPVKVDIHHATLRAMTEKNPGFLAPELSGARAYITKLRVKGNALQAFFEWTKAGAALVKSGLFKFPSLEAGKVKGFGETITGATLTPSPFWNVPAFAMSRGRIETIDAQAGGAMSEPNQNPSASDTDVTEEESMDIKALAKQLGCAETEEAVTAALSTLQDAASNAEQAEHTAALEAKDAEITALSERLGSIATAEFDREMKARVFDKGCMKNEPKAIAALRAVYDEGVEAFTALCEAMTEGKVPTRDAAGHSEGEEPTEDDDDVKTEDAFEAGDKLTKLAMAKVDKDKGIDFMTAFAMVSDENPELLTAYEGGDGREV